MSLLLRRREFLAAAVAAASLHGGQPPPPRQFSSQDGLLDVFLEASSEWRTLADTPIEMWAYNAQMPGPLLELRPGDTLRLRLRNSLPEHTNLHFHGLHVSPEGHGDNPFLMIPPEEEFAYEIEVPRTHPAGTFWYHPHVHGSTARQVFRGLSGPIVVRGELDAIPEVAAADERILVLKDFGWRRENMMDRMFGREGSLLTVSGEVAPTFQVARSGLARWRFINASASRYYRLALEEHELGVIATDGGALARLELVPEALLAPGQRLDVLVKANRPPGAYRLWNLPYDRGAFTSGTPELLAWLAYGGEESGPDIPLPAVLVPLPEPLPVPESPARQFVLQQGMMGTFGINGHAFQPGRVDTRVRLGGVEDWEIRNPGAMDHPFHLHVNSFQVVGGDSRWLDVVNVPARGVRRIRVRFADYPGRTVYHCHILDHEDAGMMGTLEIVRN